MKKLDNWFLDYVYKQEVLSEKEKMFIVTWGLKFVKFIKSLATGIISFLVLRWIFMKMYYSSGFEVTIITLVILMIIIMKMSFGKDE